MAMKKIKDKSRDKNSDLIRSFLKLKGHPENYEVWAPYIHRGLVGFIDLIIKNNSEISIFKFTRDSKDIEKDVKNLKLESSVYPKSQNTETKNIKSYLVIGDNRKNRQKIITNSRLLEGQTFEVLLLNEGKEEIEKIFELKYSIPRIFQSENLRLEDEALEELISRPNHKEIEKAIINLENPPEKIDKQIIEKMARYLKRNETPPEDFTDFQRSVEEREPESFQSQRRERDIKEPHQS